MKRSRGGFTLIEMVAAVAASAFVFAAGTILVVSSMRMQKQILSDASRVSDARVVLTMIENLASDGAIAPPVHSSDNVEIKNTSTPSTAVLKYDENEHKIYVGESTGTPLMEDVKNFTATVDGLLLKVEITDSNGEKFSTSVYCRSWAPELSEIKDSLDNVAILTGKDSRYNLISTAFGQLGSKGEIIGNTGATPHTYAEWFNSAWTSGTYPVIGWCGCFVSWCINKVHTTFENFAYVHDGVSKFRNTNGYSYILPTNNESEIIPGDVIFFDKDNKTTVTDDRFDTGNSNPLTPDHTGIVLKVDGGMVYTIEGNRHNQVAFGTYELTDPIIIGYGRLDWST